MRARNGVDIMGKSADAQEMPVVAAIPMLLAFAAACGPAGGEMMTDAGSDDAGVSEDTGVGDATPPMEWTGWSGTIVVGEGLRVGSERDIDVDMDPAGNIVVLTASSLTYCMPGVVRVVHMYRGSWRSVDLWTGTIGRCWIRMDDSGRATAVWSESICNDGFIGGHALWAATYEPSTDSWAAPVQLTEPAPPTPYASYGGLSASMGRAMVVWAESGIVTARDFSAAGWSAPTVVASGRSPVVASGPDESFAVSWTQDTVESSVPRERLPNIWVRRWLDGAFDTPTMLGPADLQVDEGVHFPRAVTASSGEPIVAWEEHRAATGTEVIRARRFSQATSEWQAPETIFEVGSTNISFGALTLADGMSDTLYAAWNFENEFHVARSGAGAAWSVPITFAGPSPGPHDLRLASAGDGAVVAHRRGGDFMLLVNRIASDGSLMERVAFSQDTLEVEVAGNTSGDIVVAYWQETSGVRVEPKVRHYRP